MATCPTCHQPAKHRAVLIRARGIYVGEEHDDREDIRPGVRPSQKSAAAVVRQPLAPAVAARRHSSRAAARGRRRAPSSRPVAIQPSAGAQSHRSHIAPGQHAAGCQESVDVPFGESRATARSAGRVPRRPQSGWYPSEAARSSSAAPMQAVTAPKRFGRRSMRSFNSNLRRPAMKLAAAASWRPRANPVDFG